MSAPSSRHSLSSWVGQMPNRRGSRDRQAPSLLRHSARFCLVVGAEGDWPCLARGGEAGLSDLDRTLSHSSVAGRVSLLGGPGVQLREGKDRPRPCSGVRGSPVNTFLGPLGPDPDCGAGRRSLCLDRKELLLFPSRA